jgi:hypothetical protein
MADMLNQKQMGKLGKKGKKGRKKRKKRQEVALTPKQKYDQALALKRAIRCMLKVSDKYFVYEKLTEDFAALSALPVSEEFAEQEECLLLSEECRKLAEEMKKQLPKEQEEEARTVTTSDREKEEKGEKKKGKAGKIVLAVFAVILCAIIVYKASDRVHNICRYTFARLENKLGMQDEARTVYASLKNYKDSMSRAAEMEKELIADAKKGETVSFGDVSWRILAKKDGAALLIKEESLTNLRYHKTREAVTWEDSDLRNYLNDTYLSKHFSIQEQELIRTTEDAEEPATVWDKIFILSSKEIKKYSDRLGDTKNNMRLRTPGEQPDTTAFVSGLGELVSYGYPVDQKGLLVRPAMWVSFQ